MVKAFFWTSLLMLCCLGHVVYSQSPDSPSLEISIEYPADAVEVLPDSADAITYGEAQAHTGWVAADEVRDDLANYWVRFTLSGEGAAQPLFIHMGDEWKYITLYGPDGEQQTGWKVPLAERRIANGRQLLQTVTPADSVTYTYYIHMQGKLYTLPPLLPLTYSITEQANTAVGWYWESGLFAGMLVIMLFYHLGLYRAMRDRTFLHYLLFVGVFAISYLFDSRSNILTPALFANNPIGTYYTQWCAGMVAGFMYLTFARSFLDLKNNLKWADKVLLISNVLLVVSTLLFAFTWDFAWFGFYGMVYGLASLLSLFVAVRVTRKGYTLGRYFLIGTIILYVAGILESMVKQPWWPEELHTTAYGELGVTLEILIFSLGLAKRFALQRDQLANERLERERILRIQEEEKQQLIAQKNQELEQKVVERTAEVTEQRNELEKVNNDLTASINYARRIQEAILPKPEVLQSLLTDSFLLFQPRDLVSGDFYWFSEHQVGGKTCYVVSVIDCTGHGVPGAFMSLIGHDQMSEIINSLEVRDPGQILTMLHVRVQNQLRQTERKNNDGMDMNLCVVYPEERRIEFAGAKNPLWMVVKGELQEIKAERVGIGGTQGMNERTYETHSLNLNELSADEPVAIYLFSDGYQDQFGGDEGKKFMKRKLKNMLQDLADKPMAEQGTLLESSMTEWIGTKHKQIDDITALGFRL